MPLPRNHAFISRITTLLILSLADLLNSARYMYCAQYFSYYPPAYSHRGAGGYDSHMLTLPSILNRMHPITVRAVRPGTITGDERVITLHSGAFGWPALDGDVSGGSGRPGINSGRCIARARFCGVIRE
jgi:hypothetical protein